jgi:hypothetical protein
LCWSYWVSFCFIGCGRWKWNTQTNKVVFDANDWWILYTTQKHQSWIVYTNTRLLIPIK